MKKKALRIISIAAAALLVLAMAEPGVPQAAHALERVRTMRATNYAPLYLDPLDDEGNPVPGGNNAGGGTTVLDPGDGAGSGTGSSTGTGTGSGTGSSTGTGSGAGTGTGSGTGSSTGTGTG